MTWDAKPKELDDEHWHDLHIGALFFTTRDTAIRLLDQVEVHLGKQGDQQFSLKDSIPEHIVDGINSLREDARRFLDKGRDPCPNGLARGFCQECVDTDDTQLLTNLVKRDDRVLRLREYTVVPGAAFKGYLQEEPNLDEPDDHSVGQDEIAWPPGISRRIRNLFRLNLDLHGELDQWLALAEVKNGNNQ